MISIMDDKLLKQPNFPKKADGKNLRPISPTSCLQKNQD